MKYCGLKVGVFYQSLEWINKWIADFFERIDKSAISDYSLYPDYNFYILLKDGTTITSFYIDKVDWVTVDKAYVEPEIGIDRAYRTIRPLLSNVIEIDYYD